MRQRSSGNIDFEAEKNEDHTFAMKQGDRSYIQADEHTEQPDLTLGTWTVSHVFQIIFLLF